MISANMGAMEAPPDLLSVTVSEAVRMTGLSRSSLYRLLAAGRLRAVKLAGRTLIPVAGLRELIATADPVIITQAG